MKYRATALGVAVAGSSFGMSMSIFDIHLSFCSSFLSWFTGGVAYPIMLQRLFERVGFAWGVRISGLVSGVGCVVATLMISSLSAKKKPGPYFDIKTISDAKFILLAIGSCFVALGKLIINSLVRRVRSDFDSEFPTIRTLHSIFLHRGIC